MAMLHQKHLRAAVLRSFGVRGSGLIWLAMAIVCGCGTTRMSDTLRTGTEQLLLSTAIDRSINEMDFDVLQGKDVYFDPQYLKGVSDEGYIVSSIRQKLLAEGVFLKAIRDEATYVVEARAGAVGTNRQDVLIGMPQTSLPTGALTTTGPSVIPEIPLAKKTHQKGVAKLAVFAYNQVTGQAVWQSGAMPITADARDTWVFGTGPFQRGSIYTSGYVGHRALWPLGASRPTGSRIAQSGTPVNESQIFPEDPEVIPPSPPSMAKKESEKPKDKVTPAAFNPAVPPSQPQPGRIPTATPPSSTSPSTTSGFNSSTFSINSTQETQGSSGGNAAAAGAAGMLFYKSTSTKPQ